jgi:hypothetical protein
MYKFAILPLFLLHFFRAEAQDRIISDNHDTINCTILSINNKRILYEIKNNDGSVTGKFIQLSHVTEYSRSQQSAKNQDILKTKTYEPEKFPEYPIFFDLKAGMSKMPWYFDSFSNSSDIPENFRSLNSGYHINSDIYYKIKSFLGLGVEYSFLKTSSSGIYPLKSSSSLFLMEAEKCIQYINYLGASVQFQQQLFALKKIILSESISSGILFLRIEDQTTSPSVNQSGYSDVANNMLLTGNAFYGKLGLSGEYRIFKTLSAGFGSDLIWSSLKKIRYESKSSNNPGSTTDNQKLSSKLNLSRIDYSLVLRCYF